MKKVKELSAQQRTNKNNKNRGKAFEKKMAQLLGWYRVPLSGSSSLFGWCDIRDAENKDEGIWLGECKTTTPTNTDDKSYVIKMEWIDKLISRSNEENKMPMLAFTLFGDVAKFVAIPIILMNMIDRACPNVIPIYYEISIKRKSKNHKNYTIPRDIFMEHRFRQIRREKMNTLIWKFGFKDEPNGSGWGIMHLDEFIKVCKNTNLCLVHKSWISNTKHSIV